MNKKIITAIIIVIIGVFSLYFFFAPGNTRDFLEAYRVYDTVSVAEENVAHIPGNGENAPRQKLNEILSRVLTENLPSEERQKLSEEGLAAAKELRAQIDTIGKEGEKTEIALVSLCEASKKVGGFRAKRKAGKIVALAEERTKTIKEVEEISYEINNRLGDIFHGIIADHGTLTPERINSLNQDLPEAEKQFDRLMESYRKLDETEKEIDTAFSTYAISH